MSMFNVAVSRRCGGGYLVLPSVAGVGVVFGLWHGWDWLGLAGTGGERPGAAKYQTISLPSSTQPTRSSLASLLQI